jgi:hypothetical protein
MGVGYAAAPVGFVMDLGAEVVETSLPADGVETQGVGAAVE